MKRRKKLWIACAALAVVVALCALALIYRPVPYEFLREASASPPQLLTIYGTGPIESFTVTEYVLEESLDEVTARARKELTAEDGWSWKSGGIPSLASAVNNTSQRQVVFYFAPSKRPDHPDPVIRVVVYEPATWIDRILVKPGFEPESM